MVTLSSGRSRPWATVVEKGARFSGEVQMYDYKVIAFSTSCYSPWQFPPPPPPPFPLPLNLKGVAHYTNGSFFPVSRGCFLFCKHYVTHLKVFFLIKMICSLNCPVFFISPQRLIKILLWGLEKTKSWAPPLICRKKGLERESIA